MMLHLLFLVMALALSAVSAKVDAAASPAIDPFSLVHDGVTVSVEIRRLGTARCTALIIVGGSNARTRGDTAAAVPLFIDPQTSVVLMDRRGNGQSTGRFEVPNTRNTAWQIPRFGADVAAVAAHLKSRGYRRVVLLGTSMGGWINVAAAAAAPTAIDGFVSISGGASSVGVSDQFDDLVRSGLSLGKASHRARSFRGPQGYNPSLDLRHARQPALWIFGALDASNPTTLDLLKIRQLARSGKRYRSIVLPNADHELVDSTSRQFDASWVKPARLFVRGAPTARC